ncbi:hypothetical protein [Amycolatopsis sp. NPDC059021]|uniref:hypothetical protein n=1 Tax=Amycolatopsis sp. NPDC059021 TaxID=3346704 RepID=UPI00366EBC38
MSVLRWTIERLLTVYDDARATQRNIGKDFQKQLSTLRELADRPELEQVAPVVPDRAMVKGVQRAGPRWRPVAGLADKLSREDSDDIVALAKAQICPDKRLSDKLFHLAVFGVVLSVVRNEGCKAVSIRPIFGGAKGPAYRITDGQQSWDLWFEAADVWPDYGYLEPYVAATAGLQKPGRTKSADIFLIDRTRRIGLLVECKYSSKGSYIREGYEQALTYLTEAKTGLIDAGAAFVVAPSETVRTLSIGQTHSGPVAFCAPEDLKDAFRSAFHTLRQSSR